MFSSSLPLVRFRDWSTSERWPLRAPLKNQSYVMLSNRVGADAGLDFSGNSMVIALFGRVIAQASSAGEELLFAGIS